MAMRKVNAVALGCFLCPWGTLAAPVAIYLFEYSTRYLLIDFLFGFGLISSITTIVLYFVFYRMQTEGEWDYANSLATVGLLVAIVLGISSLAFSPSLTTQQLVIHRMTRSCQWKGLGCAMHVYAEHNEQRLPPLAITDRDGRPLLSWRVLILPYLEQETLYKQFKLDEPWDSPHNKLLLAEMPKIYKSPYPLRVPKYHTFYQVIVGPGTAFEKKGNGAKISDDFPDGTTNTILLAEARHAVPWTKPEDIVYNPKHPVPEFGARSLSDGSSIFFGQRKSMERSVYFLMGDGVTMQFWGKALTDANLRNAIERNDGNVLVD